MKNESMTFNILTIFPEVVRPYFESSIIKRAQEKGAVSIRVIDTRDYTKDKHRSVDDTPYGGGPGMILSIEPIYQALKKKSLLQNFVHRSKKKASFKKSATSKKIVLFSPGGKLFSQKIASEYSQLKEITLICGRYEGVDYRVEKYLADETLSIGQYVLSGGEIAALAVVDAVTRLLPGVLGNDSSLADETFGGCGNFKKNYLEYPQYTKPAEFMGWKVPDILLSGDHGKIEKWRKQKSKLVNQ